MPMTLDEAIDECVAVKPLPEGYSIKPSRQTDNLLVCGPTLGFCVTRKAIDDGLIPELWAASLDALVKAEKEGGPVNLPPYRRF